MAENEMMTFSDDEDGIISFSNDQTVEESSSDQRIKSSWKILIVDDEPEIHRITQMVLRDYKFKDIPFSFYNAYSRKEAIEVLTKEKDIALILLDVVMETDDAGLQCVMDIREKLKNHDVRIILRTGQPGQAPEEKVIVDYDINDYKLKTDLTSSKLFTSVVSSLRTYNHLRILNHSRRGLERIIRGTGNLLEYESFYIFASGILEQLISILQLDENSLYMDFSSLSAYSTDSTDQFKIVAATGEFSEIEGKNLIDVLPERILNDILETVKKRESRFKENSYTGYFKKKDGGHTILYLAWKKELSEDDIQLITLFNSNVTIAFERLAP